MKVLVTGGAGYIGSHTVVELIQAGHSVVIVDDLSNARTDVVCRVESIVGEKIKFRVMDCADKEQMRTIFQENEFDAVIHFAGRKAVGESVKKPLEYYRTNLDSTMTLLELMEEYGCKKFVFSSSATVYGPENPYPYKEEMPAIQSSSPYGWSKVMNERILTDYVTAHPDFSVVLLRYFNPIGSHDSGLLGDDPNGIPNNLVPYIAKVAVGQLEKVHVFGNDYNTPDGTGVRDYIHVVDLARGHVAALKKLAENCGLFICNLGTGNGYSVLDVLHAYEKACGKELPYVIDPRRPGDIAACYADPAKARDELGWTAELGIEEMCASSWKWQSSNPNGYKG